jgi:hypothetical protein
MRRRFAVSTLTVVLLSVSTGLADAPIRTTPFPDVPKTHWAFDAVESLRQKGIIRGYPTEKPKAIKAVKKQPKPSRLTFGKRRSA